MTKKTTAFQRIMARMGKTTMFPIDLQPIDPTPPAARHEKTSSTPGQYGGNIDMINSTDLINKSNKKD